MRDSGPNDSASAAEPRSIPPITEKQLAALWQRRAARHQALRTETGARVQVLYPGRPGVTAGPDFRNALLMVEGQGLVQGDVEVHLRQRDWQAHGHHQDPNYNGVALHVALQLDAQPSRTDSGGAPPVVNLTSLLDTGLIDTGLIDTGLIDEAGDDDGQSGVRGRLWRNLARHGFRRPRGRDQMSALLNRAGDERFLAHSSRFRMVMSAQAPEQTLWESLCDALGYRHNRHPFLMLATASPYAVLAAAAVRTPKSRRQATLTDWLLRLAGFAVGPTPSGLGPPLDAREWKLFRVRPTNHPRRRILGAAAIVDRYCESGLIAGLRRAAAAGDPKTLTAALTATAGAGASAAIGPGRARDIAVNVALPFLHGWSSLAGDHAGAERTLELYRAYGPLSDNEIIRELASTLQEPSWGRVANNARRQQGLIHLQRLLSGAEAQPNAAP